MIHRATQWVVTFICFGKSRESLEIVEALSEECVPLIGI